MATIQAQAPRFHSYLAVHWLPYESLFAGYARYGLTHFDNHTNNRLERYHQTIKSVLGSSQISVGVLVDRLHKLVMVRTMSLQQAEFDSRLRTKTALHPVVRGYSGHVSLYALERIEDEHRRSLTLKDAVVLHDDSQYGVGKHTTTSSRCSCSAHCSFRLPCRHIFAVRRQADMPETELALVAERWRVSLACDTPETDSLPAHTIQQSHPVDILRADATVAQRFRTLMAIFTPMASTLAELPCAHFRQCIQWVSSLEAQLHDGSWQAATNDATATTAVSASETESADATVDPTLALDCDAAAHDETVHCDTSAATADSVVAQNSSASVPAASKQTADAAFRLPRQVKQRGRPAQARQRRFTVKKPPTTNKKRTSVDLAVSNNDR